MIPERKTMVSEPQKEIYKTLAYTYELPTYTIMTEKAIIDINFFFVTESQNISPVTKLRARPRRAYGVHIQIFVTG